MDELIEGLYRANYESLIRYAEILLRRKGGFYVSVSGRAEEVVQELFALAWERREEVAASKKPEGWLMNSMKNKVKELLREDRNWRKRMLQISERASRTEHADFTLRLDMDGLLSEKEYALLKRLYLDGYTYSELMHETGLNKSALAMRVMRVKRKFVENWQAS